MFENDVALDNRAVVKTIVATNPRAGPCRLLLLAASIAPLGLPRYPYGNALPCSAASSTAVFFLSSASASLETRRRRSISVSFGVST